MKKYILILLGIFLPLTVNASTLINGQVIATSTDLNSSSFVQNIGVATGNFTGNWTDPFHDTLYMGAAGSANFTVSEGQNIDVEGFGLEAAARVNSDSRGTFTGHTSGVAGFLAGFKVMPGAIGHANSMGGMGVILVPNSATFDIDSLYGMVVGNAVGNGVVHHEVSYWAKNKLTKGDTGNTYLSLGDDEIVDGNWAIHDVSGYPSLLSSNLTVNGTINTRSYTPASSTEACITGTQTWNNDYYYVCTSVGWKRTELNSW